MSLRRKMSVQIAMMIVGLLLISAASLWGLNGLHQDYGVALSGYHQLRQIYEVGSHLATAKTLLASAHPDRASARDEVRRAAALFDVLNSSDRARLPIQDGARVEAQSLHEKLKQALTQLGMPPEAQTEGDLLAEDSPRWVVRWRKLARSLTRSGPPFARARNRRVASGA